MRVFRKLSPGSRATTVVIFAVVLISAAQAKNHAKSSEVHIKNFGSVNDKFYRGAQPKKQDYVGLAVMGVKTIIDLQQNGDGREQQIAETQGMKFFRIGMSDRSQPSTEQVDLFLKLVNDPANQPVFVHCRGGRHRTGALTAIYRITHDGWTADQAVQEMKQFDFDYGMGHGSLKRYVYDYYSHIDHRSGAGSTDNK